MLKNINNIHFIGIGGYGMSALARVCLENGYKVTGSDIKPSSLTTTLEELGAKINYFHSHENVDNPDLVVYSTAIREDNVEIQTAKKKNIPLWHRSELLAHIFNNGFGISVAGAHGKTTTTSMISLILAEGGLDPTALIGGELSHFKGNARAGKGNEVVAEACESDHSFLRYASSLAVVTNIEADHLEYYKGNFSNLLKTYKDFIHNLKPGGKIIVNSDCPYIEEVLADFQGEVIYFGFSTDTDLKLGNVEFFKGGASFEISYNRGNKKEKIIEDKIKLQVPGMHNVYNAAAACAVALELGIDFDTIKAALYKFKGAKRRFTIVGEIENKTIIDDYAHHPTEIEATLKTAQNECPGDVIAVFQPHRYTRTKYFLEEFARAFESADKVILHKVYSAGEEPLEGVNSNVLASEIKEKCNFPPREIVVKEEIEDIILHLEKKLKPGDYVITMGAGNIYEAAYGLKDRLSFSYESSPNGSSIE